MEQPIIHGTGEFAFEHKMIPGLYVISLPIEAGYKGNTHPFHVVNAAKFKNIHYPDLLAQGIVSYVPMDKRENGVFDLIFDKKDEELSFLFETQPSLTKLVRRNVDQNLIIEQCPEKAEGQYVLMPYTLAIYDNMDKKKTYFRLIPALPMLPEKKSLELTLMFEKRLEMDVRMSRSESDFEYSLTPDVKKEKKKRLKASNPIDYDARFDALEVQVANGFNQASVERAQFHEQIMNLVGGVYNKIPSVDDFMAQALPYLMENKNYLDAGLQNIIQPLTSQLGGMQNALSHLMGFAVADQKLKTSVILDGGAEDKNGTYIVRLADGFDAEIRFNALSKTEISNVIFLHKVERAYAGISLLPVNGKNVEANLNIRENGQQSIKATLEADKGFFGFDTQGTIRLQEYNVPFTYTLKTGLVPINIGNPTIVKIKTIAGKLIKPLINSGAKVAKKAIL